MVAIIKNRVPRSGKIRIYKFIDSIDPTVLKAVYSDYWNLITPSVESGDVLWFWLFAHLTVQQGWQSSVRAFQEIKLIGENFTVEEVHDALVNSRTGLYVKKAPGLVKFRNIYQLAPHIFAYPEEHSLAFHRNQLVNILTGTGIGQAKVSLALSMLHPGQNEIICIDRHIQRKYDAGDLTLNLPLYLEMEDHWCNTCVRLGKPAGMTRELLWDSIQCYPNTRYWSYVLESPDVFAKLGPPPEENNSRKQTRRSSKQGPRGVPTTAYGKTKASAAALDQFKHCADVYAVYQGLFGPNGSEICLPAQNAT